MASTRIDIAQIIQDLGGATKAASKLGIDNPSVVLNWRTRKRIPAPYVMAVSSLTGIPPNQLRPDIFPAAGGKVRASA